MNATWPFDGQPASEKLLETGDFRGILTKIMKLREITWVLLPIVVTVLTDLAPGQTLAWDANGTGQTNGGGAWLAANLWWNGRANQNRVSGSNVIVGGPNTNGGAVTLASPTSTVSITFTGTRTLGTPATKLFLNVKVIRNWAFSTRSSTWMAVCC